ncbi:Opioid growth factor receptor (OGFr) conserved domain [Phaffia rhodozyma]|uniref:Opioid growth factor receptor (OGFr) conserved domain n=1 Tax=Phaffia rhodozyma TaxID=264483 RepID=A0A0F7SN26_PHARH|nr:Opioid growth factor receptor (OGFr) conserved domain [Phaffia rhodozyma]
MYGIRLIDPASGLLVPTWDFEDKARHLVSSTMHLHRITRILKSLVSLSPDPTSPLSVLHHVPSLILFLIAQHNSGRLNLAPGTLAGDELETRWNLCIRNRALREAISELVVTRLGMPESPTEDGRGSWKWTEAEYEAWVVSKARNAPDMKQVARLRQDADLEDMLLDEGEAGMYARAEKAERDRILAEENEAAERARTSAAEEAAKQKERQREDDTEEAKIRTAERVRTLGSDGEI